MDGVLNLGSLTIPSTLGDGTLLLMQLNVSESLFGMVQLQASKGFNQDVEIFEPNILHLVFQKKSRWWLGWPSLLGAFPSSVPA